MQDLKIPQRTFSRYLRLAFEPELRQYIAAIPVETLLIQAAIMERRLTQDRKNAYKIIFDPQLDPRQKEAMISGLNYASEVSAGIFRTYNDGLPVILRNRDELMVDSSLRNLTEFEKLPSLTHKEKELEEQEEEQEV